MSNLIDYLCRSLCCPSSGIEHVLNKCRYLIYRKIVVPLLVVITGQKCTLRCKDCGNFTPYLPQTHYNIDLICNDFQKLSSILQIRTLQIQGGEALAFPELPKLLRSVRLAGSHFINIATNGTRLLTQEQIKAIKDVHACVRISDYGINKQKVSYLIEQCKANSIPYRMYQFAGGSGKWINLGDKHIERNSEIETNKIFKNCPFKGCLTLENGIIARCSRATVAHKVQDFTPNEADLINVRSLDSKRLRLSFMDYIKHPEPLVACRYCRGSIGEDIPPAIQLIRNTSNPD